MVFIGYKERKKRSIARTASKRVRHGTLNSLPVSLSLSFLSFRRHSVLVSYRVPVLELDRLTDREDEVRKSVIISFLYTTTFSFYIQNLKVLSIKD